MDLHVSFPAQGVIRLQSRSLFEDPGSPTCRSFLERVFQAEEVANVTIRRSEAELRFCPKTHTLKAVVERVAGMLADRHAPVNGNGQGAVNGHARVNGYSNGHAAPAPVASPTAVADGPARSGGPALRTGVRRVARPAPDRGRRAEPRRPRPAAEAGGWQV
jgi:hypothetical protein